VPISTLLAGVVHGRSLSGNRAFELVQETWCRVVPQAVAERARPLSFRGGRLVVGVASAPLFEELRCFRGDEFLALLNRELKSRTDTTLSVEKLEIRRA